MQRLRRYSLSDGTSVAIEVDDAQSGGVPVGIEDRIRDSGRNLAQALNSIPALIRDIRNSISKEISDVDRIELEFGAKIGADVAIIVAKSQLEANFKITVSWKPGNPKA